MDLTPDLFRKVMEVSGVAMAIRGPDLKPIYANNAFLSHYGYTRLEVDTLSAEKVLPDETIALYAEEVLPAIRAGESWEGEHAIRTKSGRQCVVWSRFDPVLDSQGRVTHVISVMREASDSGLVRSALSMTERHLHFLSENTRDCLFRLNLETGTYDYISPGVTCMTGYTPQEFYGVVRPLRNMVPEEWRKVMDERWEELLSGRTDPEHVMPIVNKNGTLRWLSLRFTLVRDCCGKPVAVEGIMTDATQTKLAEEALKANEQKYRLLVENISDVVWTQDDARRFTYATPSAEFLWGYPLEELLQLDHRELFTPESRKRMEAISQARMQDEKEGRYSLNREVYEHLRKDGTSIWAESVVRRTFDEKGNPLGYLGMTRDITERKQAEDALLESETRFRTLFEDSPISLWEEDLTRLKAYFDQLKTEGVQDFRQFFYDNPDKLAHCATLVDVVGVNKATLELLRAKSKEDLLGNLDKVLTESSMAAFTEEMILLASGGCEYCGEITHRTLEGDIIWVVVHFLVPPEYEDSLSRVIVSLIDVTPRKRAEQALMESEERYRVVVENTREGVAVVKGAETVFVNEAMGRILGYSGEELKSVSPLDRVHPEDRELARKRFSDLDSGREKEGVAVLRIVTGQGAFRWVTLNVKSIMWGGEEARLKMLSDITPHKRLEEELRVAHAEMEKRVRQRTAELSESNAKLTREIQEREKAQAHILSLTQQLIRIQEDERQRISCDLHDKVAQDLSSTVLSMETLFDGYTIIDPEILARGKAVAGVVRRTIAEVRDIAYGLRPPALDQLGLTRTLEQLCSDTAERSGLNIDFSAVGIENVSLDFDTEINIYRMIQEALTNVVRHAGATGATVRLVKSHPDLLVRVSDDGRGFELNRRRAEIVAERRMGLTSMEERARLIGGAMEIRSRLGAGTRIILKIPLTAARRR
ncbi:PAS domain S-box protein [Pseudodesulfovibrio cashew]|uniref:PAS domain S-box protein n=2 Tax=Pseudodesulfovibrio cashew TaxID=2678688 RepID=A0A6I6JM37_9BACT|nr:PAS domain S-box protein [Pseudodesulfovibrio cashew]